MQEQMFGRYRLLKRLGDTPFAETFLADIPALRGCWEPHCALKRLLVEPPLDFLENVKAAANLMSPRIVTLYDLGQIDDRFFVVMEIMRGPTLANVLETISTRRIKIPAEHVHTIALEIARAFTEERCTFEHGALWAGNVFIADGVKVADFAIGRASWTVQKRSLIDDRVARAMIMRALCEAEAGTGLGRALLELAHDAESATAAELVTALEALGGAQRPLFALTSWVQALLA